MNTNTNLIDTTPQITRPRYLRSSAEKPAAVPLGEVLTGNALDVLDRLPDRSIDCIITSPPYHQLRRYGGGEAEVGTEVHVDDYVERLANLCDRFARVLTPTGGLWLNLGDSFSRGAKWGGPPKSLLLAPERVLLALASRGWIVRNKIVWAKPNPMPNSVTDRLATTWEAIYFLVRQRQYYFDLDLIRVPHRSTRRPSKAIRPTKYGGKERSWAGPLAGSNSGLDRARAEGRPGHPLGRNPGDVLHIATAAYKGAHHAVFPERLVTQPILAGCPERVCRVCDRPWLREKRRDRLGDLRASCTCDQGWRPGRVLDPFMGSGTVGVVAERHGRDWVGFELNPAFAGLARVRISAARKQPQPKGDK